MPSNTRVDIQNNKLPFEIRIKVYKFDFKREYVHFVPNMFHYVKDQQGEKYIPCIYQFWDTVNVCFLFMFIVY